MEKSTYYLLVLGIVALIVWALLFYNRFLVKVLTRLGVRSRSQAAMRANEQFKSGFLGFFEIVHRPAFWLGTISIGLAVISGLLHQIS